MTDIEEFTSKWDLYSQNGGTGVYYKPESIETGNQMLAGGECIIDAPFDNPLTLLLEYELFKVKYKYQV